MGVTIYDLAREAKVGIGTVSRCLNNHPSVSPETRARVLAVVKRLNYQPHAYAQRLASKKTNTISAIIPYFLSYFFVQVLQGVQDRAGEMGFDMILYGVSRPEQADYYLRRSLNRGHVDGVLFFSMRFPESYVARFQQMQLPLVLVDSMHPQFDSIRVENREGAKLATRHLISLGHRSIAMINASLQTLPAQDRMQGYREALEEAGIAFSSDRVFVSAIGRLDGFNREAGAASMRQLLETQPQAAAGPVTAAFIASDVQAIGALDVCREHQVRVPEDMAVVGFDDIELAQHARLTTMRQPMHEMGELAMDKLLARIKNPQAPPTVTSFMPELVIRESSGAPRGTPDPNYRLLHEHRTA
ncbi:MAG TPA: LacI family DNA-binding transcriptional regulator [Bacteroidota bacterium]